MARHAVSGKAIFLNSLAKLSVVVILVSSGQVSQMRPLGKYSTATESSNLLLLDCFTWSVTPPMEHDEQVSVDAIVGGNRNPSMPKRLRKPCFLELLSTAKGAA